MMEESVPKKEAMREVEVAIARLALLHLSFSKTLVEEFGEERGKEVIIKSIMEYGRRIGEGVKRGLRDLPKYGVHRKCEAGRIYGCVLARVFKEYGAEDLGCLYCYVDPAKSMATNLSQKLIHTTCTACGDDYCTFEMVPTSEKEREDFKNRSKDWKDVDPRIAEGSGPKNRE
jgi:hypothetical protein